MNESKYGYFPKTEEELIEYLHKEESKHHDYNSIAKSLTNVTVAMFNYFACKQGMTGYQSSWAGLKFLGITRGLETSFAIIDSSRMLYPQYNLQKDLDEWIEDCKPEIGKLAKENLEKDNSFTSKRVLEHWQELAKYAKD